MYWLLCILDLRFVLFLCTTAVCNKRICYVTLSLFANSNYLYAAVSACVSVYSVQCLMIVRCFVLPSLTRFTRGSRQTTQVHRTILVLLALLMCPNMCYCNFAFSLYSWHFISLSYIVLSIVSLSNMYYMFIVLDFTGMQVACAVCRWCLTKWIKNTNIAPLVIPDSRLCVTTGWWEKNAHCFSMTPTFKSL